MCARTQWLLFRRPAANSERKLAGNCAQLSCFESKLNRNLRISEFEWICHPKPLDVRTAVSQSTRLAALDVIVVRTSTLKSTMSRLAPSYLVLHG